MELTKDDIIFLRSCLYSANPPTDKVEAMQSWYSSKLKEVR